MSPKKKQRERSFILSGPERTTQKMQEGRKKNKLTAVQQSGQRHQRSRSSSSRRKRSSSSQRSHVPSHCRGTRTSRTEHKKKSLICNSLTHVVAEMVMGPEMKERPLFRLTRTSTDLHTVREMESCEEPAAAAAAAQAKIKMNCVCSLDLAIVAGLIFIKTSQRQLGRFCLIIFILLDVWFKTPKQMRTTARNVTDLQH